MELPDWTPLGEAKAALRAVLRAGDRCPCCSQRAQMYRRSINGSMAAALLSALHRHGVGWFHLPTDFARLGGDGAKLRLWGLIEEEPTVRPDGGRAGWWRLTAAGVAFAEGASTVPRWALVYDSRPFGFEGEHVSIRDCLPKDFDLQALLAGAA